jgi:type II secretory pathway component GspD/PulD (secretin)
LIAEVDLNNDQEFGIELGLQSPVLFRRGITPLQDLIGPNGGINYTNPGLVPTGVTVNNSINPAALPGYAFNTTAPLGQNPAADPSIVGFQAINNLGVGRASPLNSGVGGFVFSASSDSVSVLVRALQMQGRIEILARPQVTTLDNQQSDIVVGQSVPYVEGATVNSLGNVTPIINYRNVGVVLQVTPRISPEGKVIMRVHPEISSVAASTINLGNGINATQFNDEFVDTTVVVEDGETVAIGGMISKHDTKLENKVPWLGDLPGIGALFRFRQQDKNKTELLVILTPHIVRTRMDADQILAQESKRMDWTLGEVMRIHGSTGMEPILHPDPPQPFGPEGSPPPLCPDNLPSPEVMPAPRTLPPASPPGPGTAPAAPPSSSGPPLSKANGTSIIVPASAGSEPRRWNVNPPG